VVAIRVVDGAVTRELRRAVLRPAWPVGAAMHGDDDPAAVHLAAFDEDQLVGTCVLLSRPYPLRPERADAWQLRGMAVSAERQGQGIGAQVVAAAVAEVERRGGRLLWCEARTSAVSFYTRHGFAAEGAEYRHAETGIPHFRMWRELRGRPTAS
jgi:predicted GNAT family N-acyltransferase